MVKRVDVTDELIASLEEAVKIMEGRTAPSRIWRPPAKVDVRAIRSRIGLSQANFAKRFGSPPAPCVNGSKADVTITLGTDCRSRSSLRKNHLAALGHCAGSGPGCPARGHAGRLRARDSAACLGRG